MNVLISILLPFFLLWTSASAQELSPDEHTLLLLHFNNNLTGANGEAPTEASGVIFEEGIFGTGAFFPAGNQVFYDSANNINATAGTLEFWIKPRWNGNDGRQHFVLRYGLGGGMFFSKDGANNWRSLFNRFGVGGMPEVGTVVNVSALFQANVWHHAAFTWNDTSVKLYIDGQLRDEVPVTMPLPVINDLSLQLGGDDSGSSLEAVLDELRLSDIVRSAEEIAASFAAGLQITQLRIHPASLRLFETWRITPQLFAINNPGEAQVSPAEATWTSSDPAVASVDETGRITAHQAGVAIITAELKGVQAEVEVTVMAPVLPPVHESIDPFLATPAADSVYVIPVVIIRL